MGRKFGKQMSMQTAETSMFDFDVSTFRIYISSCMLDIHVCMNFVNTCMHNGNYYHTNTSKVRIAAGPYCPLLPGQMNNYEKIVIMLRDSVRATTQ